MWSLGVIVLDVLGHQVVEVPLAEDDEVVDVGVSAALSGDALSMCQHSRRARARAPRLAQLFIKAAKCS